MKKFLFVSLFSLLITACAGATPAPTSVETVAVATSIPFTETPTATTTPVPTETPTPPPSLGVTKPYGEWDLSVFSAEDQAKIIQAMNDPDHTPKEVKNFVDGLIIEGIRQLTGDPSYAIDADPRINSAYIGRYTEYLQANKIREVGPLPFAWREDSTSTLDNFPVWNDKGRPGYLIEGFDWLVHDPNFNINDFTQNIWDSVEWVSLRTGVGENISNFTPEIQAERHNARIEVRHNQDRDTVFGEPSIIVYPHTAKARGDLMVLTQIPGVSPEVAQEAIIRMYGLDGHPRYGIFRIQYQAETIQSGDSSCMVIPHQESRLCQPGTTLLPSNIFKLQFAPQRVDGVEASRLKMLELMNMPGFTYPLRITLQGYPYDDGGDFQSDTFMDGALVAWDIKIPTVSPDFYK